MKICETCAASYDGALERCPLDRGRLVDEVDPLLGRLLRGVYRVLAPIGRGGIATVYRARHEVVGRDVAIKVLAPAVAKSPTLRERFLREARAANRVRHPHVIDIEDIGETDDGLAFLVMELLEGRTLAQEIATGPLHLSRALTIAAQAAGALAEAHDLGVIHRDVKPANVVVMDRGGGVPFAKLLDFGLASVRGEHRLTASGELFGTPAYMAPEQIEGAPPAPAVDLYALGCVLFEMLTGARPFLGGAAATLDQHLRAPPPPPSSKRAGIPPAIDDLVMRLLAKSPADRPDARAVLAILAPSAARALPWDEIASFADRLAAALAERARAGAGERLAEDLDALVTVGPALLEALRVARDDLGRAR